MNQFSIVDIMLISAYFVFLAVISFLVVRRKQETSAEYFFAGRDMGWRTVGISLFISHISAAHLVGLLYNAWSPLFVEWLSVPVLLLLGWIVAPIYLKRKVDTVPQIFEQAYDRSIRFFVASVSILFHIFVKITVILFAGSILLKTLFGWNTFTSAYLILILTGIYVVVSGFRGILYTQIFQAIILLAGVFSITLSGFLNVPAGGEQLLLTSRLWLKPWLFSDIPLSGILLGVPVILVWYWAVDQYMVQRILSAGSADKARSATIFAGFLNLLYFAIFIGFSFFLAMNFSGKASLAAASGALSLLFNTTGVSGMLLVIVFALIMSSLAATINSASTLFTFDFYKAVNPQASDRKIVLVGRLSSMAIVIAGMVLLPALKLLHMSDYQNLIIIPAYIAPPFVALFIFGLFSKNASSKGALWTFGVATVLIAVRLIVNSEIAALARFVPLRFLLSMHYLNFTSLLFAISLLVMYSAGLIVKVSGEDKNSVFKIYELISSKKLPVKLNVILSVFLAVLTIGFWVLFS